MEFNEFINRIINNLEGSELSKWYSDSDALDADQITQLIKAFYVNTSITSINLANQDIEHQGILALAILIANNSSLTSINLSGVFIWSDPLVRSNGIKAMAETLMSSYSLTLIDLSGNDIEYEEAISLAEAIKINRSVTSINLSSNDLGCEGAIVLAEALVVNKILTSINLSNNEIEDRGAIALAAVITLNPSLTEIDLTENAIGVKGATAFRLARDVNSSEVSVHFSSINIENQRAEITQEELAMEIFEQSSSNIDYTPLVGSSVVTHEDENM